MAKEWKKSGCPFCSLNCTLEVLVEDDHIVDVRPNPDSKKEPGGYCSETNLRYSAARVIN